MGSSSSLVASKVALNRLFISSKVLSPLALGVSVIARAGEVTQSSVRAKVARRRARRAGRPRDLVVLAAASAQERQRWYGTVRRVSRWLVLRRLIASVPATVVVARGATEGLAVLPPVVARIVWVATFVLAWILVAAGVRGQLGKPLLLVCRAIGGVNGVVIKGGKAPGTSEIAGNLVKYGHLRSIRVDVRAACRVRSDGTLVATPSWQGEREVGVRRTVMRRVIEGERCVLACSGSGAAYYLLGDLANT